MSAGVPEAAPAGCAPGGLPAGGAPARSVAPDFLAPAPDGGWDLLGRRCAPCGEALFGRADRFCPGCGAEALTDAVFSGTGTVWSYTVLRNPPPGPRRADEPELPCPLALVELDDAALRVSAPLAVPVERLRIGLPVRLDPRPLYVDDDGARVVGLRFAEVR